AQGFLGRAGNGLEDGLLAVGAAQQFQRGLAVDAGFLRQFVRQRQHVGVIGVVAGSCRHGGQRRRQQQQGGTQQGQRRQETHVSSLFSGRSRKVCGECAAT